MGRIPSAHAIDRCDSDPIEHCPAPSPDVQEEGDHRSLHRGGHLERPLSSHQPVHALRSVSISQVPQGYERGRCGVPNLYEKQKEHDSVPSLRSPGNSLKLAVQRRAG